MRGLVIPALEKWRQEIKAILSYIVTLRLHESPCHKTKLNHPNKRKPGVTAGKGQVEEIG